MMRGPVWGGPQAAGKRHSQPFRAKRLPHPRGLSRPTKPVLIPYSKVVPYGIPLADERTTREAEFRQLAVGMTKPKATEIESPPHNCPANPMAS